VVVKTSYYLAGLVPIFHANEVVQQNAKNTAEGIGKSVHEIRLPPGNEVLVNFVTDPIQNRRCDAEHYQQMRSCFEPQCPVGTCKKNSHYGIGQKVKHFIQKGSGRDKVRGWMGRLNENKDAINNEGKPVNYKCIQLLQFMAQL
jgi:hypothetical protein